MISKEVTYEDTVATLAKEGWTEEEVSTALSDGTDYTLYKSVSSPGVSSYFAVPHDPNSIAVAFTPNLVPGLVAKETSQSVSLILLSADEIKAKVTEGMQAALEALCDMPARPSQIKGSVDVAVVSVEATWIAAEVCD